MIKNVIFDFGGVIGHLDRDGAVARFESLGLADADQLLDSYCQSGIFLDVESGRIDAEEFRRRLSGLCGREISYEQAQWGWLGFFTEVPQAKLDYVAALRPRYRTYVLSNTNPFIMGWARSRSFTPAGRPLDDYVDEIFTSYEVGAVKPARTFFEYVLGRTASEPSETVFVDDGKANTDAAERLGLHTLLTDNGEDWRDRLSVLLDELNAR